MLAQCIVSNHPYNRGTFTAGDVAAALRRLLVVAPALDPSRYGHEDGPLFRRHQRAAIKNGARIVAKGLEWTPAEDADDLAMNSSHALDGAAVLSLAELKGDSARCDDDLDPVPSLPEDGYGFHIEAPRETALFLDHGPWSMGFHALPPRGRNYDLEYRSRAKLRAECRFDPDAFKREIPDDIWSRVTVSDKIAEADALLDAVADDRPWHEWLTAPSDEPVSLIDYQPPKPRLRGRELPGVAITAADDGNVVISLLEKDRNRPVVRAGPRLRTH
jgi:hypothetical protein